MFAQLADGAVHGGDFGVAFAEDIALGPGYLATGFIGGESDFFIGVFGREVIVKSEVIRKAAVGLMW